MKRFVILLLLNLLIPIVCISQTTYPRIVNDSLILLTSTQLKQTNLIFAEHEMLLQERPLYLQEVSNLKEINKSWERTDSINVANCNKAYKSIQTKYKKYKIKHTLIESIGLVLLALFIWK